MVVLNHVNGKCQITVMFHFNHNKANMSLERDVVPPPLNLALGRKAPAKKSRYMMSKLAAIVIAAFLTSCAHNTLSLMPNRTAHDNRLISTCEPAVEIELPPRAVYVGADRWVLYDIADCEVHVFVEADELQRVRRAYWIQFERYIPSKPTLTYGYSGPTTQLDGLDFFVRARFGRMYEAPKSGSDLEHVLRLIRNKGFMLPKEMMNVRLAHLLDDSKRSELMIIYLEDMAPTGVTVAQLIPSGEEGTQWTAIARGLIERAKERISIRSVGAQ